MTTVELLDPIVEEPMSKNYSDSHDRFVKDTKNHHMTTLRDDGLYRHLMFRDPESGFYWYEIVTFPGTLVINGDMGSFTFSRLEDMFVFFASGTDINPHYWGEKIQGNTPFKEFSADVFTRLVTEAYTDVKDEFSKDMQAEFWWNIERDILAYADYEFEARNALADFRFASVEFADTWEWDFTEYTRSFLWNLHAIRHAIATFDTRKGQTRVSQTSVAKTSDTHIIDKVIA